MRTCARERARAPTCPAPRPPHALSLAPRHPGRPPPARRPRSCCPGAWVGLVAPPPSHGASIALPQRVGAPGSVHGGGVCSGRGGCSARGGVPRPAAAISRVGTLGGWPRERAGRAHTRGRGGLSGLRCCRPTRTPARRRAAAGCRRRHGVPSPDAGRRARAGSAAPRVRDHPHARGYAVCGPPGQASERAWAPGGRRCRTHPATPSTTPLLARPLAQVLHPARAGASAASARGAGAV